VFAYVLNQKTWAKLSTSKDSLQEIQATSDPWNDLVLDQPTKDIVEALVTQHLQKPVNPNSEIDAPFQLGDFLVGKGRGLVFLLHGPPGVGKTSTAESIAAHCSKPLYNLTSGNLGIRPDVVEDNLQSHFTLAERWGCILLLDEAVRYFSLSLHVICIAFLNPAEPIADHNSRMCFYNVVVLTRWILMLLFPFSFDSLSTTKGFYSLLRTELEIWIPHSSPEFMLH